ncbi:hypothetical protein, partial [Rhizobium freirei]|uniref:hypothetical protein n=1 Tax=Rhizobium freirei TaxID=1353277 RepID=UPI001AEBB513
ERFQGKCAAVFRPEYLQEAGTIAAILHLIMLSAAEGDFGGSFEPGRGVRLLAGCIMNASSSYPARSVAMSVGNKPAQAITAMAVMTSRYHMLM